MLASILSTTLALAGPPSAHPADDPATPTVWLDRDRDAHVTSWLAVQLVAEGYAVTERREHAHVDLSVAPHDDGGGYRVAAEGQSQQGFDVATAEDPAVVRLELLQRAVDALESVAPRPVSTPAPTAFAVEMSDELSGEARARNESEIAAVVLGEGGTLAPDRGAADFVICAAGADTQPQLALVRTDAACEAPTPGAEPFGVAPTIHQARLLVAGVLVEAEPVATVESVQAVDTVDALGRDDEIPPGLAEPEVSETKPPPRGRPGSKLVLRGGVAAGVIGRVTVADPVITASGWLGREPGLSAWLDLQMWPSSRTDTLRIIEFLPAAGMRYRILTRGRWSLDAGALFGLQLHRFDFAQQNEFSSSFGTGVAFDLSGEGALGVSFRVAREHEIQALFRAGRSGRSRTHVNQGELLWERGAWRIGATLGFTFGRELRR